MKRFSASVPTWGISESPLVDGDRLIVTPGGRGAAIVAVHGDGPIELPRGVSRVRTVRELAHLLRQ